MSFSSALVVTYGRSGSTLLQGILNAIPGVLIRGENFNLCWGLFLAYRALRQAVTELTEQGTQRTDPTHPFYGAEKLDGERYLADARALLRHQLVPEDAVGVRLWGFKEIRYIPWGLIVQGRYLLDEYLDFLVRLMPHPAIIVLTRKHEDVVRSGFWKQWEPGQVTRWLRQFEASVTAWGSRRDDVFFISYEEMCACADKLRALHAFLGASYDPDAVRKVLETPHSYDPARRG